jgi:hypothetical protein
MCEGLSDEERALLELIHDLRNRLFEAEIKLKLLREKKE